MVLFLEAWERYPLLAESCISRLTEMRASEVIVKIPRLKNCTYVIQQEHVTMCPVSRLNLGSAGWRDGREQLFKETEIGYSEKATGPEYQCSSLLRAG